ncbi:MAG: type IV secretion system protein, partial [Alphaproteobacteria bacterium]|nr:type IV secretion system protein [Alphaproteobacteria bacterium]
LCAGTLMVSTGSMAVTAATEDKTQETLERVRQRFGLHSTDEAYQLLTKVDEAQRTIADKEFGGGRVPMGRKGSRLENNYYDLIKDKGGLDEMLRTGNARNLIYQAEGINDFIANVAGQKYFAKATTTWGQFKDMFGIESLPDEYQRVLGIFNKDYYDALYNYEDDYKYTDENGNTVYDESKWVLDENGERIRPKVKEGSLDDGIFERKVGQATDVATGEANSVYMRTLLDYTNQDGGCFFCTIFEKMYEAVDTLVTTLFDTLAKDFLSLLGIGVLFLLLFKVGKMLVQLQEVDVMQFLNDLFKPLGRTIIAAALLGVSVTAGGDTIFSMLTKPVMDTSLYISEQILSTTLDKVEVLKTGKSNIDSLISDQVQPNWQPVETAMTNELKNGPKNAEGQNVAMGESTKKMLVTWLRSVASSFMVCLAMGSTFMKVGASNILSGGFAMFLAGCVIWIGFGVVYLMFPFKVVDAFVRFAFVLTLMPLWIILWVFPATQQYTKKAWEMFLSSCLLFVALGVMIALVLMLINQVVPDDIRSELFGYLIEDKNDEAVELAGFGSGLCMNAIAYTAMSFSLLAAAATIANSFVGGGGNINTNVGGGMASTIAKTGAVAYAGAKMTKNVGVAAYDGTKWAVGKIGSRLGRFGGGNNGGQGTGGSGGGSGGSGGGNGGGAQASPTIIRGERGARGERGYTGERGERGYQGQEGRAPTPQAAATDVRGGASGSSAGNNTAGNNTTVNNTAVNETGNNTAGRTQSVNSEVTSTGAGRNVGGGEAQPMGGSGGRATAAVMPGTMPGAVDASASPELTDAFRSMTPEQRAAVQNMTPEKQEAIRAMAGKANAAPDLKRLAKDTAFIEQNMHLPRDKFMEAMKGHQHEWQTDPKKMQAFAEVAFNRKDNPDGMERETRSMLSDYFGDKAISSGSRGMIENIAADTGKSTGTGRPNRMLSAHLEDLSIQVAAAQTGGSRRS